MDRDVLITNCHWVELDYRTIEGGTVELVRIDEVIMSLPIVVGSDFGLAALFRF